MPSVLHSYDCSVIALQNTAAKAFIAPGAGGLLLNWIVDGKELIYWPKSPDWSIPSKIRGGNPVLFPFIGKHYVNGDVGSWMDGNGVVRPMPSHGFARDLAFSHQLDADGQGVTMTLKDSPETRRCYPYSFTFAIHYRLLAAGLDVEWTITNEGDQPMPYYAGHHFYFSIPAKRRAESTLSLPANSRQHALAAGGLSQSEPGEQRYSLADSRLQDQFHVLTGGCEPVRLDMPWQKTSITFDLSQSACPWYAVATWAASPDADSFCIEPWLGAPDAIHHGQGLRWLSAGTTETALCRLRVEMA